MEIKSKFSVGDVVYCADTTHKSKYIACPDCLGTKKWTVVFADGEITGVDCQTCKRGWEQPSGEIDIKEWTPEVVKLTIGSVRYDGSDAKPFSFMCEETGVGSGRIYYEDDLFLDKETAQKRANEKYQEQMKTIAANNFSKRFVGTKEIENALASFGFSRKLQIEKARQFKQWFDVSKLIS